ncbi:MAG: hypothetical protein R2707_10115 [Acidimicrobiales bacterium]
MVARPPLDDTSVYNVESDTDEHDANNRVHHHARIDDGTQTAADGTFTTLCGLRIRRRPEAARMPCCPMCALVMGAPCR